MNTVCVSGYKTKTVVSGDDFIRFSIVAKNGYSKKEEKDLTELIPCCLFSPSDKMREILSTEDTLFLELKGRISSSKYEKKKKTHYSTQVIVEPSSINFVKTK